MMKAKQTKTKPIYTQKKARKSCDLRDKTAETSLDEIQFMVHNMCENAFSKNIHDEMDSCDTAIIHRQSHQQSGNQYMTTNMTHTQVTPTHGPSSIRSSCFGKYSHNGSSSEEGRKARTSSSKKRFSPAQDEDLNEKYDVKMEGYRDHKYSRSIGRQIHDCLHSSILFAKITVEFKDNINSLHESSRKLFSDHHTLSTTSSNGKTLHKISSLTCRDIAQKADEHLQGSLMTLQHEIQSALFSIKNMIDEMETADDHSCDFIDEEM